MRFPIRSVATLFMMAGVATCSDTPIAAVKAGTSPATRSGIGRIALAPVFSKSAQYAASHLADFPAVHFDSVRVVIRGRPDTTQIVKDTTVFFDVNSPELTLDLNVPVQNDGQQFNAAMDYRGPAGVVFHGVQVVQSHRPDQPAPVQAPLVINYVGAGAKVKSITVAPRALSLVGVQTSALTVTAVDSNNSTIAVPLAFTSSNSAIATVSNTGLVQGQNRRGTATVLVQTPSGVNDNVTVSVSLLPSSIGVVSGNGQSGRVGSALANPAVIQVSAPDGIGVPGIPVIFAGPTGGSVSPTTATTDANGRASTTMRLGSVAGPQGFTATAAGFSTAINVTATAGDPSAIAIVSGNNQADSVRATLAPLVVRVSDSFNNPIAGVVVSWTKSGNGTLGAASTTTNSDGVATNTYTLGTTPGAESVTASAGSANVNFAFTTGGGRPASITAVSGAGQTGRVLQTLPNPFVVKVVDAAGNPVRDAAIAWSAQNATIASTTPSDATGQASATVTLGNAAGSATVTAAIAGGPSATFGATVQPGLPAVVIFSAQPANGNATQPLAPVRVALRDVANNSTEGVVTLALGNNPNGAVLGGTLSQPTLNGVATFGNLTIDRVGAGYTLRASASAGVSATSTPFNVTAGAAAAMTIVAGNGTSARVNSATPTPPAVKLVDAANNPIVGASVTFAPSQGSGSVTPANGVVTTDAQGVASLTAWTLGTVAGTQTLSVTSPGVQPVTFSATANAGNAFRLVVKNKASLQTSIVSGATLSPQPTVQVTDEFGNDVPAGQMQVSVAPTATTTTVGGTTTFSLGATTGVVTFTNLSLAGSGTTKLVFTEGSGQIKPDTSNAIGLTVGPAAHLRLEPSSPTSFTVSAGQTITLPQVKVVDAQGNAVSGVTVHALVDSGTAATIVGSSDFVSNVSGLATLAAPPATVVGTYRLTISSAGIPDTLRLTATVTAGAAYRVTFGNRGALQTTMASGATLSPQPVIWVVDQYGNKVSTTGVTVAISTAPSTGFTVSNATLSLASASAFTGLSVAGAGAMRLVVAPTTGTLLPDSSNTITVSAGSATQIAASGATSFTGVAGSQLGTRPAVVVRDASNNAVSGATIVFTVTSGSGSVDGSTRTADTVLTNASGIAQMSRWTLPTSVGTSFTVNARPATGTLSGAPVTFSATTTVGTLAQLSFVVDHGVPASFENNALFANGPQLRAADVYGNPIPGVTIDAQVDASSSTTSLRRPGPSASLATFFTLPTLSVVTSATTNSSGVADFAGAKLRGVVQSFRLTFTARGTSISVSAPTALRHGAAANAICTATLPGRVRLSHRLSVSPRLKLFDIDSNIVSNAVVALAATAGSIASTSGSTDSTGEVSASTWDVRGSAGDDSIKVSGATGGCHVRAADAHRIKLSVTSLARQKNGRLIPSIDATVVDSDDAELEDEAFSIVAVATPQPGKSLSISRTKSSNTRGRATFDSLMVDGQSQSGAYLKFSSVVGPSTLRDSLTFDIDEGDPEALDVTGTNTVHGVVGTTLSAGTFSVQVKDHSGRNNLNSATNTVTWTPDATGCTGVTFRTSTSQATGGIALSPEIAIAAPFSSNSSPTGCKFTASAPGLTSVTFTITP